MATRTTTKVHPLLKEVNEARKAKITDNTKTLLTLALTEAERRRGWVEQRKQELREIDAIVDLACKAHDAGDAAQLSQLRDKLMVYQDGTFKGTRAKLEKLNAPGRNVNCRSSLHINVHGELDEDLY